MNEGFLGKFSFGGERAATDDHPTVLHYLPLTASATAKLDVGVLLKAMDIHAASVAVGGENTDVTATSVTAETFAAKVGNKVGTYVFAYDTAWKLSGQAVTIADYGVSLTGSPASGDTVTVTLIVEDVAYAACLSTDAAEPCAVVDLPCDPTRDKGEKSVAAVVHGTVKTRVLKTGDNKAPTGGQLAVLARHGVFAV